VFKYFVTHNQVSALIGLDRHLNPTLRMKTSLNLSLGSNVPWKRLSPIAFNPPNRSTGSCIRASIVTCLQDRPQSPLVRRNKAARIGVICDMLGFVAHVLGMITLGSMHSSTLSFAVIPRQPMRIDGVVLRTILRCSLRASPRGISPRSA
jgi:hypothetical protein